MLNIIPQAYLISGGFFFFYFIILWIYCRRIPAFGWFWPLTGIICTGIGLFTMEYSSVTPDGITVTFWSDNYDSVRVFFIEKMTPLFVIILSIFMIAACILAVQGNKKPSKGADYLIILGAHVNGTIPSKALMSRILSAYDYLKSNPSTKAVLTGGQGRGEIISEALCMKQELLKLGIDEQYLLLEDSSTTTKQNIAFATELILKAEKISAWNRDKKDIHLIIVTNDFHALRGRTIGKAAGFQNVESIGATSSIVMRLHYYTREMLSWMKFVVTGMR